MRRRLLALAALAALSGTAAGTVASARANGPVMASARIPAIPPRRSSLPACPIPARFRLAFEAAAAASRLPLPMLVAVAEVESNLRPQARSATGARGLLQVMPATAATLALNPDRPRSNVLAGARYLRLLLDRFHSADLALAAYNAGPTAVDRAGGAPDGATLGYVADVSSTWRSLAGCR